MFYISYALYKGACTLAKIFREVVSVQDNDFRGDEIVGRFIGVRVNRGEEALEGCLRVSFKEKELLSRLLAMLRKHKVHYKIIYRGRGNVVLWFKHGNTCKLCPLVHGTSGVVPKTMLVTPMGLLFEFISTSRDGVDRNLFETLISGKARKIMTYMLTPREQEVLYYAYSRGYYDQPRSISLDKLSKELGLSKSTLNEILRSAESKIITAYMRHDLPHLIVDKILKMKALREPVHIEERYPRT